MNLKVDTAYIIHWFNALRDLPEQERRRGLDAFWAGQIDSKAWLVNTLNDVRTNPGNVYIFGGWVGLLGNLLLQASTWGPQKIRSIDLDPWCEGVADTLNQPWVQDDWKFKAVTADMGSYNYDWNLYPDVIINTSTEHVDQTIYDQWFDNIPSGSMIVLQGNNYFDCSEHVRCSSSLLEFKRQNYVTNTLFEGSLPHDIYTRYMTISIK